MFGAGSKKKETNEGIGSILWGDVKKVGKTTKKVSKKTASIGVKGLRTGKKALNGIDNFMENLWKG